MGIDILNDSCKAEFCGELTRKLGCKVKTICRIVYANSNSLGGIVRLGRRKVHDELVVGPTHPLVVAGLLHSQRPGCTELASRAGVIAASDDAIAIPILVR